MPNADQAVAIASALGTTVEYLVTGREPKSRYDLQLATRPVIRGILDKMFRIPDTELSPVIILTEGLAEKFQQTPRTATNAG